MGKEGERAGGVGGGGGGVTTPLQQAAGVYWECAIDQYLHRSGVCILFFFSVDSF